MKIFNGDGDENELEVEHDDVIGVGLVDGENGDADGTQPEWPGPDDDAESDTPKEDLPGPTGNLIVRPKITIDSSIHPVAHTLRQITDQLIASGNCFRRCNQVVAINNERITPILNANALSGFLSQHVEFYFSNGEVGRYRSIPGAYANTWLNNSSELARLPEIKMFTRNPVFTEDWRLVSPGYDADSGIYYAGPKVAPISGTEHLDKVLIDFCFKSDSDRDNYVGLLITILLMSMFIGAKPIGIFNANQPGLGKSILAHILAIMRDGYPVGTVTYTHRDDEFEKQLCAMVRRGDSTIIIDNAKTRGRNTSIESAVLERLITDAILSFRLLGQSSSIRIENSILFLITANTPNVCRDIVDRSLIVNVHYEGAPERRRFSVIDPEKYVLDNRVEILGELIGMVMRWIEAEKPMANVNSRFNKKNWGNIVGGILAGNGYSEFLKNAEEAAEQLDETRGVFAELVAILAADPQEKRTAAELVEICAEHRLLTEEIGSGTARSMATKMGTLATRFINEPFAVGDGRVATFQKLPTGKGDAYAVSLSGGDGEPIPKT